jgi:hypothetical protein
MKTIEAFQVSDGRIFTDERDAHKAQDDIIGEEIDGLLKLFNLDITRNQQYKAVLEAMNKRDTLRSTIKVLLGHLEHTDKN